MALGILCRSAPWSAAAIRSCFVLASRGPARTRRSGMALLRSTRPRPRLWPWGRPGFKQSDIGRACCRAEKPCFVPMHSYESSGLPLYTCIANNDSSGFPLCFSLVMIQAAFRYPCIVTIQASRLACLERSSATHASRLACLERSSATPIQASRLACLEQDCYVCLLVLLCMFIGFAIHW